MWLRIRPDVVGIAASPPARSVCVQQQRQLTPVIDSNAINSSEGCALENELALVLALAALHASRQRSDLIRAAREREEAYHRWRDEVRLPLLGAMLQLQLMSAADAGWQ